MGTYDLIINLASDASFPTNIGGKFQEGLSFDGTENQKRTIIRPPNLQTKMIPSISWSIEDHTVVA